MSNILLIEPDYRSKFPPLGLLRLSSYHKSRGDAVTFARGRNETLQAARWHRIYVSSLFTWELPRTVRTIKFYQKSVSDPRNIFVGGIGATLMPDYLGENVECTVVRGLVDRKGKLGTGEPSLESFIPDYAVLDSTDWEYKPEDSYFARTTKGCIRKCPFCAVPNIEPRFSRNRGWRSEITEVKKRYGERQHLVLLDNNVLANGGVEQIIGEIRQEGFEQGAMRGNRQRTVDFNQGIDARLVTKKLAKVLRQINLTPVRLAFDYDAIEPQYRKAVAHLAEAEFPHFTNYVMFNFNDTPKSLYRRLKINLQLSRKHGIAITSFPMRYIPINDVSRQHVADGWHWRYLRGIQCVLLATRGMVSPNRKFFVAAFGNSYEEFLEILSMPDRYIIHRRKHENGAAADWQKRFRRLSPSRRSELMDVLFRLNGARDKKTEMARHRQFKALLEHYYPDGETFRE